MIGTSGGRFDPDAERIYFLASNPLSLSYALPAHEHLLISLEHLAPQTGVMADHFERCLDTHTVLLDSGIYTLANAHARQHDLHIQQVLQMHPSELDGYQALIDLYYEKASAYADRLWGIVELDLGGEAVKREVRAQITKDTGLHPIPVYHPLLDTWDYYDEIASTHDRIAFANLTTASPAVRVRLVHTAYERSLKHPHLWTHLLGIQPSPITMSLPMRGSMDASTWLTAVRWAPSWKTFTYSAYYGELAEGLWFNRGDQSWTKVVEAGAGQGNALERVMREHDRRFA